MTLPIDVVFRNLHPSPLIDAFVRRCATRLQRSFERIQACHVVIDRPHQAHVGPFHVHVRLAIPGNDVVVSREPALDGAHDDLHVAIRDAFRAARRQLEHREHRPRRASPPRAA